LVPNVFKRSSQAGVSWYAPSLRQLPFSKVCGGQSLIDLR
jgi:hypothetical protein